MTQWTSRIDSPLGTQRERGVRGAVSGPLSGNAALGLAFGTRVRDGFTVNDVTGNALDDRSATFGRAQFLFMPTPRWETRFIVGGERDRDGDYALNDLEAVRRNPYHVQRNVEGYTDRDIWSAHDPRPPRGTRAMRSRPRRAASGGRRTTSRTSTTRPCRS